LLALFLQAEQHEDVALELEAAGARAQLRAAVRVAITAMRRAAELCEPASRKVVEVPTSSHCAMLSHPQSVAELIGQAAEATC
jgi:hypothetical protein